MGPSMYEVHSVVVIVREKGERVWGSVVWWGRAGQVQQSSADLLPRPARARPII